MELLEDGRLVLGEDDVAGHERREAEGPWRRRVHPPDGDVNLARGDACDERLDVGAVETFVAGVAMGEIEVAVHRVDSPTPRAFGLATLMASDVVLAEDESAVLQEFHDRVMAEIDDEGVPVGTD